MPVFVDEENSLGSTVKVAVEPNLIVETVKGIQADEAIAPNKVTTPTKTSASDEMAAEPSNLWWDMQFRSHLEEHLGKYGY